MWIPRPSVRSPHKAYPSIPGEEEDFTTDKFVVGQIQKELGVRAVGAANRDIEQYIRRWWGTV